MAFWWSGGSHGRGSFGEQPSLIKSQLQRRELRLGRGERLSAAAQSSDSQSGLTEGPGNCRLADGAGFSRAGGTAGAEKPVVVELRERLQCHHRAGRMLPEAGWGCGGRG